MSTPPPAASTSRPYCPVVWLKSHLTPYHLTVAAVLGLGTVGFTVLVAVLLLICTNFNVLGFIE